MISVFLNTTTAHSVEPCRPCVPCIYSTFLNHNLFAAPPRVDPTQNSAFSRFSLLIRTRHISDVWCSELRFQYSPCKRQRLIVLSNVNKEFMKTLLYYRIVCKCLNKFFHVISIGMHICTGRMGNIKRIKRTPNKPLLRFCRKQSQFYVETTCSCAEKFLPDHRLFTCLFQTLTSSHINENLLPHGKDILSHLKKL